MLLFLMAASTILSLAQPVITFTPSNATTDVNENTTITVGSNVAIRRTSDDANLDNTNVNSVLRLKLNNAGGPNVAFTATINAADTEIIITPDITLPSGTTIYAAIHNVETHPAGDDLNPDPTAITFTVRDYIAPDITFSPASGATNLSINTNIQISFDEAIRNSDDSEITNANVASLLTFKLTDATGADVAFTATINPGKDEITVVPDAPLTNNQIYYVSLDPVEDDEDNATATENITFTTTNDTQPPVPTFNPADASIDFNNTADIIITFDEPIRNLDNSVLGNTSIDDKVILKLTDAAGADISFNASIDGTKTIVTINPTGTLPDFATIYVAIHDVEDVFDHALASESITFTTGDGTPPVITFNPLDDALNIPVISNIVISFDEAIRNVNDSEITDANVAALIDLKLTNAGGADVPFTATINAGKTAITIDPTTDLNPDQVYYVRIDPVENTYNRASISHNINFTTTDTQPPSTTFSPANGATLVNNNTNITITFSEAIRDLTDAVLDDNTVDGKVVLKLTDATGANIPFDATINVAKTVITINPTGALPDLTTIYVAVSGVEDGYNNPITTQSITFGTTDGTPPVATFDPANGSSTMTISGNITITFNEPIRLTNNADITDANVDALITFKRDNAGGSNVGFNATIDASNTVITINPDNNLTADQTYYVAFATIEDQYNNSTSGNITFTTQELTVVANASSAAICTGDDVTLSAVISGGNGFYNISWTSTPAGFTSSDQIVTVSPSVSTTYTCVVTDSDGNTNSATPANIEITVNVSQDPDDLEIKLSPPRPGNTYQATDSKVTLSFDLMGSPGSPIGSTHFEGTGVNSATSSFFPNAANIGPNDVTLFYENAEGCITTISEVVTVSDNSTYFIGLNDRYCGEEDELVTINSPIVYPPIYIWGLTIETVYTFQDQVVLRDIGTGTVLNDYTFNSTNNTIGFNTLNLGPGTKQFELYYQIQTTVTDALGAETVTMSNAWLNTAFSIIPKQEFLSGIPSEVCKNDPAFPLLVKPAGGTFELNGDPTPTLDPSTALSTNTVTYSYTDENSCVTEEDFTVIVNAIPSFNFSVNNGCVDQVINFTSTINNPSAVDFTYAFDYDGNDDPDTTPLLQGDPSLTTWTYELPAVYQAKMSVRTSDGCVESRSKPVTIGEVPDVKLSWANVCDGDATQFRIESDFVDDKPGQVDEITWVAGEGYTPEIDNDKQHSVMYATTGYFKAYTTVSTVLNCSKADTVLVYKVNKIGPLGGGTEYFEDFNVANVELQAWKSGGTNSSWEWGELEKVAFDRDSPSPNDPSEGKAWVTNRSSSVNEGLPNWNEDSWVHSGCIDLTAIQRPILSFDFRSLMKDGRDGVVLQYNTKNTTDRESDWITIGNINSGRNWYDKIGIDANPGNQALLQTGWTGMLDLDDWRTAVISLDQMINDILPAERDKVRFRFAFGSADFKPEGEGFTFDNFKITQRDRVVLLEQFTNNGGVNAANDPNRVSNNAINNFLNTSLGEAVKIEYHLGISGPNEDPIYESNRTDANARSAFYGISSTPTTMVDARTGALASIFTEQTLKDSEVTIDYIQTPNLPAETFNVDVKFTAKQNLPPNTVLHIAVIEKLIDNNPDAIGTNGETSFTYVMRKLLPDATGTKFSESILENEERTVSYSWSPRAFDFDQLAVVAFVQNEDTKEIYQARIMTNPTYIPDPAIITDREPSLISQIRVYPNPADKALHLELPVKTRKVVNITLLDSYGRNVHQSRFDRGEQSKTIDTKELSGGLYVLQLETPNGIERKKIVVVHE